MKILVLYGSSRENGNTELLTESVLKGIKHSKIYLREKNIVPIEDKRHSPEGFQPVNDDYDDVIRELLNHDVIFFSTPIYWYGMSGTMKNFVDRWSQSLRDSRYNFKEIMGKKKVYVILTGGDYPKVKGLPLIQQFQYIFDYVSAKFCGYIIGEGNKPNEVLQDQQALAQAKKLNKELCEYRNKVSNSNF